MHYHKISIEVISILFQFEFSCRWPYLGLHWAVEGMKRRLCIQWRVGCSNNNSNNSINNNSNT